MQRTRVPRTLSVLSVAVLCVGTAFAVDTSIVNWSSSPQPSVLTLSP